MAVAGDDDPRPALGQPAQDRRTGVGLGAVAPGDGPGVDLDQHAAVGGGVGGLEGAFEIPGVGVVEQVAALVELHHQVHVAQHLRAALTGFRHGAEILPAHRVGIAAEVLIDGVRQDVAGVVHAHEAAPGPQVVHRFDDVVVSVRGRRREPVVLVAQQHVDLPGVLRLQPQDVRPVQGLDVRGHGAVVVVGAAVLGEAQGVKAQPERRPKHVLGGVPAVGIGAVGVYVGSEGRHSGSTTVTGASGAFLPMDSMPFLALALAL